MATLRDYRGIAIRLTNERLAHILSRREMWQLAPDAVADTLLHPEIVVRSRSDREARLYYRRYAGTPVGDKFLCVVVADREADAFVLTAYLTDSRKSGEVIWQEKS